ncbi:MAG: MarR family transcriptional regulator [Proteobacteria bacterium]|nr:MarR family transcriptional regulator [Pseudomonadota bacterium]
MNMNTEATLDPIEAVEELAQELMRQLDLLSGSKVQEDISYGQYKVISVIHNQGPISVGNLGRYVGSAQSTTSEMVARLTKAGLVTKVRGPYDGRVVMVELTDQGRQLMKRRRKRVKEAYQNLFSKLSGGERDSLVGALRALNDILSKGTE